MARRFFIASVTLALAAMISTPMSLLIAPQRDELAQLQAQYEYEEYLMDIISGRYLPAESAAHSFLFIDCGVPLLQFAHEYVAPIPEMALVQRAREFRARVAPNEVSFGGQFDQTHCLTRNCSGLVSLEEVLFAPLSDE